MEDSWKASTHDLLKETLERAAEAIKVDKRRSVRGVAVEHNLCHVALTKYLKKNMQGENILNGNTSPDNQDCDCTSMSNRQGCQKKRTRVRNKLTLAERVRAIEEYERYPVYQHVAQIMNCSFYQIKRIIRNKDLYLLSSTAETLRPPKDAFEKINRLEKIYILNKVIFEWIQRSKARKCDISTKLIRSIALNVRQLIRIPSFFPDAAWLETFMTQYNITAEDLNNRGVDEHFHEEKCKCNLPTNIPSIIKFVMKLHNESKNTLQYPNSKDPDPNNKLLKEGYSFTINDYVKNEPSDNEVILIEDEGEEDSGAPPIKIKKVYSNVQDIEQLLKMDCAAESVNKVENCDFKEKVPVIKEEDVFKTEKYSDYIIPGEPMLEAELSSYPSCSSNLNCPRPVPIAIHCGPSLTPAVLPVKVEAIDAVTVEHPKDELKTHEDAINCVKMLEEFALQEENIRLIGLIERLEEALFTHTCKLL